MGNKNDKILSLFRSFIANWGWEGGGVVPPPPLHTLIKTSCNPCVTLILVMMSTVNDINVDKSILNLAYQLYYLQSQDSTTTTTTTSNTPADEVETTTEYVLLESSEHVAVVTGKGGYRIKMIREQTNTFILTPARGVTPIFTIAGRKQDVNNAKWLILTASHQFTRYKANKQTLCKPQVKISKPVWSSSSVLQACSQKDITIEIRVPYGLVGLVVGHKGFNVKRIELFSNTCIFSPTKGDKDPIFYVTGWPENVATAKREIQAHIGVEIIDDN